MMIRHSATIVAASVAAMILAGVGWWAYASTRESAQSDLDNVSVEISGQQNTEARDHMVQASNEAGPEGVSGPPPVGLKLSRQSFQRGGLGARALISFTVRNDNDYAVKDIGILCAFTSRDGRYVTLRRKTIPEPVSFKERKKFPKMHIGFVNAKVTRARCSLLTATPV